MENKNIEVKGKGIRVKVLSAIFVALGVVVMGISIVSIRTIYSRYDEMSNAYQHTEVERESILKFQAASDYLTEQSIKYAVTGDTSYLDNYFIEKNESKNREDSIAIIGDDEELGMEYDLLVDAMKQSETLVGYELHAMKLTAVSNNLDVAKMAEELASYELTADETALSKEQQHEKAIEILFGKDYENYKDRINWDTQNANVLIKEEAGAQFRENEDRLISVLNITTLLIFIMFILLVLIFICSALLVVRPADLFTKALHNKEKLPEIGGYEFRKFARKYNDIYRSDKKNKELLKEQGEIDELTGTLKVGTLDIIRHNLTSFTEGLGIMLVDIDGFRALKEKMGYDVGDKVVKKVAKLFTSSFKSSDYVVRVSQDAFEIFMPKMKVTDSAMIIERIDQINEKLSDDADGVPTISVSVGVAFSESGYDVEVERKADMALNNAKGSGRKMCKIAE